MKCLANREVAVSEKKCHNLQSPQLNNVQYRNLKASISEEELGNWMYAFVWENVYQIWHQSRWKILFWYP